MTTEPISSPGAKLKLYRDAPSWHGLRTAAVGSFSCDSADAGTALLADACNRLAAEGFAAVLGPLDGNTWAKYRLVIESDGSRPFLMEPTSAPHDLDAFTAAGFTEAARYFSARVALADVPPGPSTPEGITISAWDGTAAEARFTEVHALSCTAFSGNAFYTPVALEPFLAQYMPYVPVLRPELLLFARDTAGDLVGFLFGIPNYGAGNPPDTVVLKTYASLRSGVGGALAARFHDTARALGFATAIHALIHDDNTSAERSRINRASVFRRYALMGRRLGG